MKKIVLALLIGFSGFAQHYEVTPSGLKIKGKPTENFVVIDVDGKKANDLYNLSINYINQNYKNPDDVIKGKIENQYLRFDTYVSDFMTIKNSGAKVKINATYTIELNFKDNKFRFEIINLVMKASNSDFFVEYKGSIWKGYPIYNNKEELRLPDAKEHIEKYFDSKILEIYDYLNNKKSEKSDW